MEKEIAILTVPANEWNDLIKMVKNTVTQLSELTGRQSKDLLTPDEVCDILKISRSTYERFKNEGIIPIVKVGGRKYSKNLIKRSDIEKLIADGTI